VHRTRNQNPIARLVTAMLALQSEATPRRRLATIGRRPESVDGARIRQDCLSGTAHCAVLARENRKRNKPA
jgi:hypothetical protein